MRHAVLWILLSLVITVFWLALLQHTTEEYEIIGITVAVYSQLEILGLRPQFFPASLLLIPKALLAC